MKTLRMTLITSIIFLFLMTPFTGIKTQAVTVDIKDNYDAGLLSEEKDTKAEAEQQKKEDAAEDGSSAASTAASTASTAASTTPAATPTATPAATAATSAASTVTPAAVTSNASTTASTSTDMPKTGDDDRIMITITIMLASLAVFLTTLMGERHSKKA